MDWCHLAAVIGVSAAAGLFSTAALAQPAGSDSSYTISVGPEPLEKTAGEDLRGYIEQTFAAEQPARPVEILIGTPSDHPQIAEENRRSPFKLNAAEPESYHFSTRNGKLYIVGQSAKGAMNGVFRFMDRRTMNLSDLDESGSPAFRYRIGDHLRVQKAPPDWTEEQQARYYASHYINVVWGEKFGPPLSHEARKKYGLGLMLEITIPRLIDKQWMNDPANADAIYEFPHYGWMQKAVDPFHPAGRKIYIETIRRELEKNPDTVILSTIVGDYSHVPRKTSKRLSDGKEYGRETRECIWELMGIMKEAIGDRPIVPTFWLWHAFLPDTESFIREMTAAGYGIFYNEAGDGDDWVYKLDNFGGIALKTGPDGRSAFGRDYILLASVGGTCESTHPAVGLPLPRAAAHKMRRMADAGISSFALWWGSCEGWAYHPNTEVAAQMIWNPQAFSIDQPDLFDASNEKSLLAQIARRDFGAELAPEVLEFWKLMDEAMLDKVKVFSWFQRTGVFLVFWDAHTWQLDPASLRKHLENKDFAGFGTREDAIENFGSVIRQLQQPIEKLRAILNRPGLEAGAAEKLRSQDINLQMLRHTLIWQHNQMRGAKIVKDHPDWSADSEQFRELLKPIIEQDLQNTEQAIVLLEEFAPNFRLGKYPPDSKPARDAEIQKLQKKLEAMRAYAGE